MRLDENTRITLSIGQLKNLVSESISIDFDKEFQMDGNTLAVYTGPGGSVEVPMGVRRIGEFAFDGCSKVSYVYMHPTVRWIGKCAFRGCTGISYMDVPYGVTEVGDYALFGCERLVQLRIPSTVRKIGRQAFDGCPKVNIIAHDSIRGKILDSFTQGVPEGVRFNGKAVGGMAVAPEPPGVPDGSCLSDWEEVF